MDLLGKGELSPKHSKIGNYLVSIVLFQYPAPQSVLMCIALRKYLLTLRYTFSFFYSNVFY